MVATLNVTIPSPVPLAPPVTVRKLELLAAVHAQPAARLTETDDTVAAAGALNDGGDRMGAQAGGAGSVVTVQPMSRKIPRMIGPGSVYTSARFRAHVIRPFGVAVYSSSSTCE